MDNKIFRCYIFSEEQENFLRSNKYNIDRMECFMALVDKVVRVPTIIDISDHRQIKLTKGQFMVTDVELSDKLRIDRKTVGKLMKQMEALGIFSATKVAEVIVYSMHAFSAWIVDGVFDYNPFYHRPPRPGEPVKEYHIPEITVITKPVVPSLDETVKPAKKSKKRKRKSCKSKK